MPAHGLWKKKKTTLQKKFSTSWPTKRPVTLIIRSLALLPYEPDGNAHQNIQQNPHNREDHTGGRKNRFVQLRIP